METIFLQHPIDINTLKRNSTVMALGFFDGVHKGHQAVINKAIEIAKQTGTTTSVMTFNPHPKEVLRKQEGEMKYITPLLDKIEKIRNLGVDTLYVVKFTRDFAELTPQEFVDQYLIGLNVIHAVAGFDFTYGALGKGTMETLPFHSRGKLKSSIVEKLEADNQKVSSTRIRALLEAGEVENVTKLLGEPYSLRGTVIDGEKRGRTIGFPTANIKPIENNIIPKTGVYAVMLKVRDREVSGVCNIGYKPTFHKEADEPVIEVHLFSFNEDIYGEEVELTWFFHIRDEQKFPSLDDLVKQISLDKEKAMKLLPS
ncbi:bifunctional riboflavin kinase/FAD synthetase [Halalkalibacter krulwichiae]|uniref:Riboflavin biosynthesis protein n=1 Tax=Halalkalibacter krulwichiae TaxID=199441 RepID=A0A1X9MC28_9BACI|nr:bifunctional riboflavin kinase/FAD synthetase [Halalkalibacter krulwichiae]ARK30958.1 Riboflavin biosynthesis protein RibF [Halalkalibacter krulwichiae]